MFLCEFLKQPREHFSKAMYFCFKFDYYSLNTFEEKQVREDYSLISNLAFNYMLQPVMIDKGMIFYFSFGVHIWKIDKPYR